MKLRLSVLIIAIAIVSIAVAAWAAVGVSVTLGGLPVGQVSLEPGIHTLTVEVGGQVIHQADIEVPNPSQTLVFTEDTTITEPLTLRAGDSIELRNGARLTIAAPYDWQGTPVPAWSWDGINPSTLTYNTDRDVDIFGAGDVLFAPGSGAGIIKYVEVDLQPAFSTGHYPLHWHMLGDETRGTLVENVVVKNSTFRAYVPHASHGITFRDVIAQNVVGEAVWWDKPGTNCSSPFPKLCTQDNTNDLHVDRLLVDGVSQLPSDSRGYTLTGVMLQAGSGNSLTNSFVRGVWPTHVKDCSAYQWPSTANQNVGGTVWEFTNNYGVSRCHGIFVWQNDGGVHTIDGFAGGGIDHGAYGNNYTYKNVDVPYVELHAASPKFFDSLFGDVIAKKHQNTGQATFTRVTVSGLVKMSDVGGQPYDLHFIDSDVTCNQVVWYSNTVNGSQVFIDGIECERP